MDGIERDDGPAISLSEPHIVRSAERIVDTIWQQEKRRTTRRRIVWRLAPAILGFLLIEGLGLWTSHILGQPLPWAFSVITGLAMIEATSAGPKHWTPGVNETMEAASACPTSRVP